MQRRLVLIPGAILAVAAGVLLGLGGRGAGACAPPPPAWHQVTTLDDLWWLAAPLAVFFVGEYFALSADRRSTRVLTSVLVLLVAGMVAFVAPAFWYSCGSYAP